MKIACPNCQQDWVHVVSHPDLEQSAFWCPEEDCLWFTLENLLKEEQIFGVTFTRWQSYETLIGRTEFWQHIEDKGIFDYNPA